MISFSKNQEFIYLAPLLYATLVMSVTMDYLSEV